MIPKNQSKAICLGEMDIKTREPINIEQLWEEYKAHNDPLAFLTASDSDECVIISSKDACDIENKPILQKKPSSTQKKI